MISKTQHVYRRESEEYQLPIKSIAVVHERGRGIAWRIWPAAHVLIDWMEKNQRRWCKNITHCIEIGAGVGLVGIAAAALGSDSVTITDLPEELAAIRRSVDCNEDVLKSTVNVEALRFGNVQDMQAMINTIPTKTRIVILASDIVYWESLFIPIAETLSFFAKERNAVSYIGYKIRHWKTEKRFFTKILSQYNLHAEVVFEGLIEEDDLMSQTSSGTVHYKNDENTSEQNENSWNTRVYKISQSRN
jgi:predicted nicotinamide N-methyase